MYKEEVIKQTCYTKKYWRTLQCQFLYIQLKSIFVERSNLFFRKSNIVKIQVSNTLSGLQIEAFPPGQERRNSSRLLLLPSDIVLKTFSVNIVVNYFIYT